MNPTILSPVNSERDWIFNLDMATDYGEGKL